MKLSVYISYSYIEYVLGDVSGKDIKIAKAGKIELDDLAIQRGDNLQNEEILKQKIYEMKTMVGTIPKEIDVLLSATLVLNKLVEVPILPQNKLLDITKSEMVEYIDAKKEYIYDYSVLTERLNKKKSGRICCVAMEKEMYQKYSKIFAECMLRVTSLDISLNSQIHMIDKLFVNNQDTYILAIMDGLSLVASLYVKGQLIYNSSSRISVRGNLGVISELIRVLSTFIQFNKSQRNDTDVVKIYMVGLYDNEKGFCQNIKTALSIDTELLPEYERIKVSGEINYSMQEYFYSTGNLLRK